MENHPIPQDITGFQFKLIGNMTVRQFAYLAAGIIIAWIFYILPLYILIKLPFSLIFGLSGVAFAFLPIEGRPMDLMINNFVKALFNPTQFIYAKTGGHFYSPTHVPVPHIAAQKQTASSLSGDNLKKFLDNLPKRPQNKLDEKEMVFFQSLTNISNPTASPTASIIPTYTAPHIFSAAPVRASDLKKLEPEKEKKPEPIDSQEEENQNILLGKASVLEQELQKAKQEEMKKTQGSADYNAAHQKVLELETLLNETVAQKQGLENKILSLQKKLDMQGKKVYSPSLAVPEKEPTKNIRSIPKGMGKSIGIPNAPEYPNLVTGIIKDPRSNPLPNILVEIKDYEGNPVRAFKTNALGQFASATPLVNGTYTIEFEDPNGQNKFDIIQFSVKGEIILPVEVISVDTREELRRTLFN
ncbi:MAG: PrgI family protein [Candidatus Levyibacteriota bacterium]